MVRIDEKAWHVGGVIAHSMASSNSRCGMAHARGHEHGSLECDKSDGDKPSAWKNEEYGISTVGSVCFLLYGENELLDFGIRAAY